MTRTEIFLVIVFFKIGMGNTFSSRDELVRQFQMDSELCRQQVGASAVDLQHLMDRTPPATEAAKCLRSCLMKKYNVMDSNGKFVPSVALDEARRLTNGSMEKIKIAIALIRACADIQVSVNDCEAAAEYDFCFRQEVQRLGLPLY